MKPKISVIIPTYNREDFIADCIESAINQDYPNLEIIVVDNNSIDRTFEIANAYSYVYKNIKVFKNNENLGPVKNWFKE